MRSMVRSSAWLVVAAGWTAGLAAGGGVAFGQSDNCAGGVPLPMGVVVSSLEGATADGVDACRNGVADVWYTFTAPRDGVLFMDACGTNGTPVISVHTGCPGTVANMIQCNYRDSYHCGERPHVEISCVAGQTYRVRVGGQTLSYTISTWFEDPKPAAGVGPDIVSGDIPEMRRYPNAGDFAAMAFGSTACNIGTTEAIWTNVDNSNQHPVIATSMYRVKDGIFEQIGYAWLKHGWASGTETFCDYCPATGVLRVLLPGCSDSYDVPQNGTQQILAARSEVDPTTGVFPYPPISNPAIADSTSRRIRVLRSAIDPAQNPDAVYLGELEYIAADDAAAGNAMNNVSYRPIRFASAEAQPVFTGPVVRTKPAILGWADLDPSVAVVPADVMDRGYQTRFWVGSKVTEIAPGRWRYVYSAFNLNADRACGGFVMTRRAGVRVSAVEQRFVPPHSGETYSGTPWAFVSGDAGGAGAGAGSMGWRTQTFAQNPNANALRWGTTHTWIFESSTGPVAGSGRIELFNPGEAGEASWATVALPVPGAGACPADFNGDSFVDFFDYDSFVTAFEVGGDLVGAAADINGDGFVDFFDYGDFVAVYEQGC